MSKSEVQNNILKIISAQKKVGEMFLLDYPSIIPSLNYDFGDQYQPCRDGTFLDFYSDYHPDLYG